MRRVARPDDVFLGIVRKGVLALFLGKNRRVLRLGNCMPRFAVIRAGQIQDLPCLPASVVCDVGIECRVLKPVLLNRIINPSILIGRKYHQFAFMKNATDMFEFLLTV